VQYSFTQYASFVNLYWTVSGLPFFYYLSWRRQAVQGIPLTAAEKGIRW
jgi:hypothetical protein